MRRRGKGRIGNPGGDGGVIGKGEGLRWRVSGVPDGT